MSHGLESAKSVRTTQAEKAASDLHQIAFAEARRVHLNEDDAHDCAMEMVLHALTQAAGCTIALIADGAGTLDNIGGADLSLLSIVSLSIAATHLILRADLCHDQATRWLRRCARNFAHNYRRNRVVRERYETASSDPNYNGSYKSSVVSAETEALMGLFRQDIYAAAHALPPAAGAVFARFHFQEDSIAEIALSSGKSESAVKQQLYRLRQQVRATLVEQDHHSSDCGEIGEINASL